MAVDVVLDREDALESPAVTRYDVVVLDRDLPGIHGDEVCQRIVAGGVLKVRRATEYAPLVIPECSAAELPPTLAGLMLGFNAYLTAARKLAALAAVMDLDYTRLAILDADGQLLIQGGPGSGKTTIALLNAARTLESWTPSSRSCSCRSRGPPSGRSRPRRPAPSPHRA